MGPGLRVWISDLGTQFRLLSLNVIVPSTQNAFWGSGTARHLGPTPRGGLRFGRMLACRTRTARNRRVKDARRSVTGPFSAASARYLRIGDSGFGAAKPRFLEMAT